ncbi:uncharacterized protein TNCT_341311 [Trichonephila clavata]|uniref:Uncharacterized protein n=1 Tax=Trichonephila clavata TaxID=2740835 RepID=A0A8X6ISR9_TRICU|nr:uncharacterized protein TNCT_341311 [Trichonephila clavata]
MHKSYKICELYHFRYHCYCLAKYFNKLLRYGDQHRTSQYLKNWTDNERLKRNSPFSQAHAQYLSFNVEHHCLTSFINPVLGLQGVTFHTTSRTNVNKMSNSPPPELLKQLALEVIDGIPLDAVKIYINGSRETNTTGNGVLIELPGRMNKIQRRNADQGPVFRTELIAIMCCLSLINNIQDQAFSEIWNLTDS